MAPDRSRIADALGRIEAFETDLLTWGIVATACEVVLVVAAVIVRLSGAGF